MRLMQEVVENRLLDRWSKLFPRAANQVGGIHETDAELVSLGDGRLLAATVDSVVEETRSGLYLDPRTAGRIAAVAALSDLAAVGARPLGLLLSVAFPGLDATMQGRIGGGVSEVCLATGVAVLGGDTSDAPELSVTCVALGLVDEGDVLMRCGMRAGDAVYVSGALGAGARLAAERWVRSSKDPAHENDYAPLPRLSEGAILRGLASACMDTSDGFIATIDQLARINDVSVVIDRPLSTLLDPDTDRLRRALGLGAFPFLAAHHGEFELVFTIPATREPEFHQRARSIGWQPIRAGMVEAGEGVLAGGVPIDGARVRNLLTAMNGDVADYVAALRTMHQHLS